MVQGRLKSLTEWVRFEKRDLWYVVLFGAASSILSLIVPIAVQSLVNTIAFSQVPITIVMLTLIVLLTMGFASIQKILQTIVVEWIQRRVFIRVTYELANKVLRMRLEVLDKYKTSDLMNRFFEVTSLQKGVSLVLVDGFSIVLQAIAGMLLLGVYHPLLLIFDLFLGAVICLVIFFPARSLMHSAYSESVEKYRTAGWLDEIGVNAIHAKFSEVGNFVYSKLDYHVDSLLKARDYHFQMLIRQNAGLLIIQVVSSAVLLGLGGYLVLHDQLTLGQLVAAEIVVTSIVSGVAKLGKYLETAYDLHASLQKLNEISDLDLEKGGDENGVFADSGISISLKNVTFAYPNQKSKFDDIQLQISSSQKIGFYGSNGSGKSTLLDLILGLRKIDLGTVHWSNQNINEIDIIEARTKVALIRNVSVFDGTILENICLGSNQYTLDQVRAAMEKACFLEDVQNLKDGLSTKLSSSITPLSPGQKQKLALSRVFLTNPKLVVLDDALDAIDEKSREKIVKNLCDQNSPWTLMLASHDKEDLKHCERIFVLKNPQVLEANYADV